jgi:hypothetical protein
MKEQQDSQHELANVEPHWGKKNADNFGYASNEERLEKRGMEDWELVEKIPQSQNKVPYWFMSIVVIVLLVGVGLSFPFWGLRPGVVVEWTTWVTEPGFLGSLVYISAAAAFVYYMVHYSSPSLEEQKEIDREKNEKQE